MSLVEHGISLGIHRINNAFYVRFKVVGKLTHADYEMITPMLDDALASVSDVYVNALVDATELDGWELRAAWDDLKLGVKHRRHFQKVAVVGNKPWEQWLAKIANWFVAGEVKYFDSLAAACDWLQS